MMGSRYLCVLYVATAGQQGQRLGSDEEEVVLLIYVVIDVALNKVSAHAFGCDHPGCHAARLGLG